MPLAAACLRFIADVNANGRNCINLFRCPTPRRWKPIATHHTKAAIEWPTDRTNERKNDRKKNESMEWVMEKWKTYISIFNQFSQNWFNSIRAAAPIDQSEYIHWNHVCCLVCVCTLCVIHSYSVEMSNCGDVLWLRSRGTSSIVHSLVYTEHRPYLLPAVPPPYLYTEPFVWISDKNKMSKSEYPIFGGT